MKILLLVSVLMIGTQIKVFANEHIQLVPCSSTAISVSEGNLTTGCSQLMDSFAQGDQQAQSVYQELLKQKADDLLNGYEEESCVVETSKESMEIKMKIVRTRKPTQEEKNESQPERILRYENITEVTTFGEIEGNWLKDTQISRFFLRVCG